MFTLQEITLLVTGEIVLSESGELRGSCKEIPVYEEDTKRSNVSMCLT